MSTEKLELQKVNRLLGTMVLAAFLPRFLHKATTVSYLEIRLLAQSELLLARGSSEDALFAALFLVHALVRPCAVVASDINPSWEKGVVRNIQEFKTMADCCGPQIAAALSDPKTKSAIDALNADATRFADAELDWSIYSEQIQLADPTGVRARGLANYKRFFQLVRLFRSLAV